MPVSATETLRVFVLNVGQADTALIVTPSGHVAVIDAVNPGKIINLLADLGLAKGEQVDHLILTHPHEDHYSGAARLLNEYDVRDVVLSSFEPYTGTAGYHAIINQIEGKGIPCLFVPSHNTLYLDGALAAAKDRVTVDLVGPSQAIINGLDRLGQLNPNHLSLIARVTFGDFTMVLAADAQMENWQHFDEEGMMRSTHVVKAAHHGSRHGTQAERLERLEAKYVVVSSDPDGRHSLPDLIGAATLFVVGSKQSVACLTRDSGTVEVNAGSNGSYNVLHYGEDAENTVPLGAAKQLSRDSNPTDWAKLVRSRLG